jgi:hypothetical protein
MIIPTEQMETGNFKHLWKSTIMQEAGGKLSLKGYWHIRSIEAHIILPT